MRSGEEDGGVCLSISQITAVFATAYERTDVRFYNGFTALHFAASRGHTGAVALLTARGADLNLADEDGQTPLFVAAAGGHSAVVGLLLAKGADACRANTAGQRPQAPEESSGSARLNTVLETACKE